MYRKLIVWLFNKLEKWFKIIERNWEYSILIHEQEFCRKVYVSERNIIKNLFIISVDKQEPVDIDWFDMNTFLTPNKTNAN